MSKAFIESPLRLFHAGGPSKGQHGAFVPQPNCKFNVDANSGHAFGILLAAVGALRPFGAPAPVN